MEKRTFTIHRGWGDHIEWFEAGVKVWGHLPMTLPERNDWLEAPMQSGKVGIYRFVKIDREDDPPDMFYGDVEFSHYKGEPEPEEPELGVVDKLVKFVSGDR